MPRWFIRHFPPCGTGYEKGRHGLPAHRSPSAGNDPGTTPPRAGSAPSGPAQKRDNETHRLVPMPLRVLVVDRGLQGRTAARSRAGEKPAGKRLATDKRHRVDTDQGAKGLPPQAGGKERGPDIVWRNPRLSQFLGLGPTPLESASWDSPAVVCHLAKAHHAPSAFGNEGPQSGALRRSAAFAQQHFVVAVERFERAGSCHSPHQTWRHPSPRFKQLSAPCCLYNRLNRILEIRQYRFVHPLIFVKSS